MNYYAIMQFFLFSPWGWAIIGLLIAIIIFANLKVEMATNIERAMITIDPDDPQPDLTREYIRSIIRDTPRTETKGFWFCIQAAAIIILLIAVVLPFFMTYSGWVSQ